MRNKRSPFFRAAIFFSEKRSFCQDRLGTNTKEKTPKIDCVSAGNLGEVPLAAHSVLQNVGFFMFPLTFGTSTATTVRVGTLLGAGRGALARCGTRNVTSFACDAILYSKCSIILPRHARDKHRESSTQKEMIMMGFRAGPPRRRRLAWPAR